jgi:hypothetical protein
MLKKSILFAALSAAALAWSSAHAAPQLGPEGFIVVGPDGSVIRATKGFVSSHAGTGQYEIDVVSSVHGCVYSATAGSGDATLPPRSFASAVGRDELPTAIMVGTFDGNGQPADLGFHLIVRC